MKKLLLQTSIPKIYMIVMLAISVLMIGSYFSYAMFTVSKEKSNAISIVTGSLTGLLKVDGVEGNTLEVPASSYKVFTIELSNPNSIRARFNFYYTGVLDSTVDAGYVSEDGYNIPPAETGIVLEAIGSTGSSQLYKIIVINNGTSNISIPIGYKVSLENSSLSLPTDSYLFSLQGTGTLIKSAGHAYDDNTHEDISTEFWAAEYRHNITSITTKDNNEIPTTAIASWDISEAENGKAVAYVEDDGTDAGTYKLTLGGVGGLLANPDMSNYFSDFYLENIDFTYLDTSNVTNMSGMFVSSFATTLDLSGLDTSSATDMSYMFAYCFATTLNLSGFDTSKVIDMTRMFMECSNLTTLYSDSFDVSNVQSSCEIFLNCNNLEYPSWYDRERGNCDA